MKNGDSTSNLQNSMALKEAVRAQEELEHLLSYLPAVIFRLKLDGRKITPVFVSENISRLLGFTVEEALSYEWWLENLHPHDRRRAVVNAYETTVLGTTRIEYRLRHKNGSYIWIDDSLRVVRDSSGNPVELVGVWMDITDRKLTEDRVRFLTCLPNEDPNPVLRITLDGTIIFANPAALPLLQHWERRVGQQLTGEWSKLVADIMASDVNKQVEFRIANQTYVFDFVPVFQGQYINAYGRDITKSKQAEHQLRLQAAALETIANAVIITERDGTIIWTNAAFTKLTGYTAEEAIGKTPRILKSGKHSGTFYKRLWDTLLAGEVWCGHFENRRKDGSVYRDEQTITPILSSDGAITHFVCVMNDISGRLAVEDQLRQSQKMEAIGYLAGGVAHDFNNLLTIINGRSQLMINRTNPGDKMRAELELVYKTGQRAANLTRQLLAFSRKQLLEPKVLDLNGLTADLEKMLRRLIPENIDLTTALDPALKMVLADPGQIEQVILNLVVNARDSMPSGGKLTIRTANEELDCAYCKQHIDAKAGHYSMISISDTGAGMDTKTKARIFEPFFTTKPAGHGTGLGLSTVYGIVKQSSGYIDFESEVGMGTTFRIYLPHTQSAPAVLSGSNLHSVIRGNEVILVVEDEEDVREVARDILELNGYTVLVARNGSDALRLCEAYNQPIQLLVTDVVMPQMGGTELAECLKRARPDTKVLFTSGYTDHGIVRNGSVDPNINFLQKPFTTHSLASKVRMVLDRV